MNISDLNRLMEERINETKQWIQGEDIKLMVGTEAVEHFKSSFQNEGFTDETLEPWKDVKRRDPSSSWYGHSEQTGKFSKARTNAKILSGHTSNLRNGITFITIEKGVRVTSPVPYGRVHQEGLTAKVYGKKTFQMPARPFMGKSKVLIRNINDKISREIFKKLSGK